MKTKTRLTDAAVKKMAVPTSGTIEVFDTDVVGLSLRVTPKGTKSWCLIYRFAGKSRRMTLGHYPALGVKDVRAVARGALGELAKGVDPVFEKKRRERKQARVYDETFRSLARRFMREYERGIAHDDNPNGAMPLHKTWKETQQLLDKYVLPEWGSVPATELTRADVRALLEPITKRSLSQANKTFAIIRKLFNWATQMDLIDMSPCGGLKKPNKSLVRNRPLRDEEIRAVWDACVEMGYPFGHAYRLLLVTGQRRSEVCAMEYTELDLKHVEWILPAGRTKANRRHVVPLTPLALEILKDVPPIGGRFVFTTTLGRRPVSGYSKATKKLVELSGLEDFRLHDLRETMATTMRERLGIHTDVVGQVLNHAPQGVTQRHYAANHSVEDIRKALLAWNDYLNAVITRETDNNVISFREAGSRV